MLFTSSFSENEINAYIAKTASYIKTQRDLFAENAAPFSPGQFEVFKPFFSEAILKTTLFFQKQDGPLENPDFLKEINEKGIHFSLERTKATTFIDVVVFSGELDAKIQFHELVHAVQYQKMGHKQFANKYMRGLLRTGEYTKIPLEVNAYNLQEAFMANPDQPFSVEAEVQKLINENKF